jgi:hypothetical protein
MVANMSKEGEPPLQFDLFTGELVDNRSAKQKRSDKEKEEPQQAMMFSQRDMAQFGVEAHPKLPLSPKTRLELMVEDYRTEEEKATDIQRAALEHNFRMFEEESSAQDEAEDSS